MRYIISFILLFPLCLDAQEQEDMLFSYLTYLDGSLDIEVPYILTSGPENPEFSKGNIQEVGKGHYYPDSSWHIFFSGLYLVKGNDRKNKHYWGANISIHVYDVSTYRKYWGTHSMPPSTHDCFPSVVRSLSSTDALYELYTFSGHLTWFADTSYTIDETFYRTTAGVDISESTKGLLKRKKEEYADVNVNHYIRKGDKVLIYSFWNWGVDPGEVNNWISIAKHGISTIRWSGITEEGQL